MSNMIQIRRATTKDVENLASLMMLAMHDIISHFIGSDNRTDAHRFMSQLITLPDNQYSYQNILVAERNEEIPGQICLYDGGKLNTLRQPIIQLLKQQYDREFSFEDETADGEIYLDTIAVFPHTQGQGIGKILLQHVIEEYVFQKGQTLGLLVDKENPHAKSLYLRMGFTVQREVNIFGKNMEHLQIKPI